jgi:hypothetical protein
LSELTLTLLRLGLLAVLWLFVFSVVGVLRSDLYGTRVSRRRVARSSRGRAAPPVGAGAPGRGPAGGGAGVGGAAAYGPGGGGGAPAPVPGGRGRARGIPRLLVVTEGRLAGTTLPLGSNGVLIGRNPECALVLDDDFSSGRHARIFPRDGGWFVEDLGSTNGTFLGPHRLTGAVPVTVGTVLRIGRTVLELQG